MRDALVAIALYGCATVGGDVTNLDAIWRERMLTEHYGTWHNGKEVFKPWEQSDTVHSFPDGASFTVYRIKMSTTNNWGNGEEHNGGLLARAASLGVRVELFGKMFAPIRMGGISIERGEACDILLVVRAAAGGYGRLVKHWRFPPQELLLTGDPVDPEMFRRSTRSAGQRRVAPGSMGTHRFHFVDAYLDVDEPSRTATVTVTGLKRPFAERVDLAPYVDASSTPVAPVH